MYCEEYLRCQRGTVCSLVVNISARRCRLTWLTLHRDPGSWVLLVTARVGGGPAVFNFKCQSYAALSLFVQHWSRFRPKEWCKTNGMEDTPKICHAHPLINWWTDWFWSESAFLAKSLVPAIDCSFYGMTASPRRSQYISIAPWWWAAVGQTKKIKVYLIKCCPKWIISFMVIHITVACLRVLFFLWFWCYLVFSRFKKGWNIPSNSWVLLVSGWEGMVQATETSTARLMPS